MLAPVKMAIVLMRSAPMSKFRMKAAELALERAMVAHSFTALAMEKEAPQTAAMWRAVTIRYLLVRDYCKERGTNESQVPMA